MSALKKLPGILLAIVLIFNTLTLGTSAVLGDGNELSANITLQVGRYNTATKAFTPLAGGVALRTNDVITVRICPQTDFLVGSSNYVAMFDKTAFSVVGINKAAFSANTANTFFDQTASGYSGVTQNIVGGITYPGLPATAWPASFGPAENYNVYTAIKVGNQADSNSNNGGYPNLLPGDWLFQFSLKVLKDLPAGSDARIWTDSRWFKSASNKSGDGYFAKCLDGNASSTGQTIIYNFKFDMTAADIKLPLPAPLTGTITFDSAGGTAVASITGDVGSAVPAVPAPEKTGYSFVGWIPEIPTTFPAENLTCTAQWVIPTVCVTFNANGGFGSTFFCGHPFDPFIPPAVTRPGYIFIGWSPALPPNWPSEDTTYTALWAVDSFTITFDANGGSGGTTGAMEYGTELIPPLVIRTGYTLDCWSPEVPATVPAEDATYVAQWQVNSYTISFDANGGTGSAADVTQDYDTEVTLPTTGFVKTGYTFIGWNTTPDAVTVLSSYYVPAADVSLYAIYEISYVWICFDANGGEGYGECVLVRQGDPIPLPTGGFTKTGYTFIGWNTDPKAASPVFEPLNTLSDMTLYAIYQINQYTVWFDPNGGIGSAADVTQDYGTEVPLPTTGFAKTGYTFIGWSTDPEDSTVMSNYYMPAGGVTLYAIYEINTYNAVFMVDGTIYQTIPTVYGENIVVPAEPAKVGYDFIGWSPDVGVIGAGDMDFTAQWMKSVYYIYYYVDGELYMTEHMDTHEIVYINISINLNGKTGYSFIGWAGESIPADHSIILNATYQINTYNAYFLADNQVIATVPTMYGAQIIPPADPVKPGYDFIGWTPAVGTIGAFDVEFNARWNRIPVFLSAKAGSVTVIDGAKGFIYGLEEGMTVETFLSSAVIVSGDGRIEVQYFTASFGTHTRIDLVDNVTGRVVKSYTIIIFGDINGDGSVDSMDAGTAVDYENYLIDRVPPYDKILLFAGDLNGDGCVDSLDAGKMVDAENYVVSINQVTGLAV